MCRLDSYLDIEDCLFSDVGYCSVLSMVVMIGVLIRSRRRGEEIEV